MEWHGKLIPSRSSPSGCELPPPSPSPSPSRASPSAKRTAPLLSATKPLELPHEYDPAMCGVGAFVPLADVKCGGSNGSGGLGGRLGWKRARHRAKASPSPRALTNDSFRLHCRRNACTIATSSSLASTRPHSSSASALENTCRSCTIPTPSISASGEGESEGGSQQGSRHERWHEGEHEAAFELRSPAQSRPCVGHHAAQTAPKRRPQRVAWAHSQARRGCLHARH